MTPLSPPQKRRCIGHSHSLDDHPISVTTNTPSASTPTPEPASASITTTFTDSHPDAEPDQPSTSEGIHYPEYKSQHYNQVYSSTSPTSINGSLTGSTSWLQDGFSQDPGFLASQEELRCIIFSFAHSAAPTRVGSLSPDQHSGQHQHHYQKQDQNERDHGYHTEDEGMGLHGKLEPPDSISSLKRIEYLKNYVAQVAPWVSSILPFPCLLFTLPLLFLTLPTSQLNCYSSTCSTPNIHSNIKCPY